MDITAIFMSTGACAVVEVQLQDTLGSLRVRVCSALFGDSVPHGRVALKAYGAAVPFVDDSAPVSSLEVTAGSAIEVIKVVSPEDRARSFHLTEHAPSSDSTSFVEAIELDPCNAEAFMKLALAVEGRVLVDGDMWCPQGLLKRAITLGSARACEKLANLMKADRIPSTILEDGHEVSPADLFGRAALLFDTPDVESYYGLAYCIGGLETYRMSDTCTVSQADLFIRLLELEPDSPFHLCSLSSVICPGTEVILRDGSVVSREHLALKALQIESNNATALLNLACAPLETFPIAVGGAVVGRTELLLMAIELEPDTADAYFLLAVLDGIEEETHSLQDGRVLDRVALLQAALEMIGKERSWSYEDKARKEELTMMESLASTELACMLPEGASIRIDTIYEANTQMLLARGNLLKEALPMDTWSHLARMFSLA